MSFDNGQLVGPYEVLQSLGAGGMGEVFRARDTRLNRDVALKFLKEGHEERFVREAQAISQLNHPNICALYDVGVHEGRSYLVMEYIEGEPARGPIPPERAIPIAIQIAEGLDAAHRSGIIHRDLKPENILITTTGVKLLDFGLARFAVPKVAATVPSTTITMQLTAAHTMVGTPQYMSPEQLQGKSADARSDIFALGCAMYEMLTGRPAFTGATIASVIAAVLERNPPPVSELQPLSTPELDHIVEVALAKDPDERWQSAGDMARMLRLLDRSRSDRTSASPMSRRTFAIGGAGLVAGAVGGYWLGRGAKTKLNSFVVSYLGGPPAALTPRVSPDGKLVAFVQVTRSSTHLCVLKPDTGDWSMLAEEGASNGTVDDLSWSPDSSRIHFARYTDRPAGVYSVPALGGQQRLLLENARGAQSIRDGSLLISRQTEEGFEQLCRFWPETGKVRPYDAATAAHWYCAVFRAFPDGREAVFYGWPLDRARSGDPDQLWALDLESGRLRPVAQTRRIGLLANNYPIAVTPDGGEVAVYEPGGDMERIVAYPRSGGGTPRVLFAGVPPGSTSFDIFPDGSVVYDKPDRSGFVLRFGPPKPRPDYLWTGLGQHQGYRITPLSGGQFVVAGQQSGRFQLMLLDADTGSHPLVNTSEPTMMPCAEVGVGRAAVLIGAEGKRRIAVVEVSSGRVLRVLFEVGRPVSSMSYSPAADMLYFTAGGSVWRMALSAVAPEKVRNGEYVAAHPKGDGIVVFAHERFQPRLIWKPLPGGAEQEIQKPPSVNWANSPLGDRAIREDGMMVCPTSPPGGWYFGLATVDLNTRTVQPVDTEFVGDLYTPSWSADGGIVAAGMDFRSSLLRVSEDK